MNNDTVYPAPASSAQRGGVRSIVANARKLRRSSTDVEKKLWHRIRDKQIEDFRFRRQRPIGKFIVDFICLDARLIVELDGGQHAENTLGDSKRTEFLESLGYKVVRFWNNEVIENMEGVLDRLREELLSTRSLTPPSALPLAGEGTDRTSAVVSASTNTPSPAQRGKAGMGVRPQNARARTNPKEKK